MKMQTEKDKTIERVIQVVSKNNTVFVKSNTETNKWHPTSFQWVPVFEHNKNLNQSQT